MRRPPSRPYLADMGAPCVLASHRPSHPIDEASFRNEFLAAVGAGAVEDHVMARDGIAGRLLEPVDRPLEAAVLERLDLAAGVAHEMVMVVAAGMDRLVAGDAGAKVDPLHEALRGEEGEDAGHARDAHASPGRPEPVEELLGGQAAGLLGERGDEPPRG